MVGKLLIHEARPHHAPAILDNLSAYGIEDLSVAGADIKRLEHEISVTPFCHVATWDGKVAAMWGIKPHSMFLGDGYLWLITTKVVEEHPFQFIRYSRILLEDVLGIFPTVHGVVLPKDDRSVRWLKLLKFEVGPPEMVFGERYRRFIRRRG